MQLKEYLDTSRISKARFARRIGVSRSYISHLLSGGIKHPSMDVAKRIVDATAGKVNFEDLLR